MHEPSSPLCRGSLLLLPKLRPCVLCEVRKSVCGCGEHRGSVNIQNLSTSQSETTASWPIHVARIGFDSLSTCCLVFSASAPWRSSRATTMRRRTRTTQRLSRPSPNTNLCTRFWPPLSSSTLTATANSHARSLRRRRSHLWRTKVAMRRACHRCRPPHPPRPRLLAPWRRPWLRPQWLPSHPSWRPRRRRQCQHSRLLQSRRMPSHPS